MEVTTPEEYIAQAPEAMRPLLDNLRAQLRKALPDAEEIIAYKMPGFRIGKTIVAGYAAFSKQCGLYVAAEAIKSLEEELKAARLKPTKTGVTFSPSKPIADELVKKLVLASRKAYGL